MLANNGMKLIKVSEKSPKVRCPPPTGETASMVPLGVPTIQEDTDGEVEDPAAKTAAVVNTGSIDSGDDYR